MNHKKNIWHQLSKTNEPLTLYMEQDKKKKKDHWKLTVILL